MKARLARNQEEVAATRQRISEAEAAIEAGRKRLEVLRAELGHARDERYRLRGEDARLREEKAGLETELALLRAAIASEQADTSRAALAEGLRGEASTFLEVTPGWERACEAALYAAVDFLVADAGLEKLADTAGKRPDLRFGFLVADGVPGFRGSGRTSSCLCVFVVRPASAVPVLHSSFPLRAADLALSL